MILLISAKNTLVEMFARAIPASTPFIHLATVAETQSYLTSLVDDQLELALIVVDAQENQQVVADCCQLYQSGSAYYLPIIAVIARPADRQAVLKAGADDYLLLPLLPAEIQTRLANYLCSTSRGLSVWIEAFCQMNREGASAQVLKQSLKKLAQIFNAPSAWLFLCDSTADINLLSSYNLPPLLHQNATILNDEARLCLKLHQQDQSSMPRVISASNWQDTNGLTHYLSLPLNGHRHLIGVLNLAYTEAPQISRTKEQALAMLGRDIGILLEVFHLQEEAQTYAIQNAFMVLIARTISEHLDLNTILSLSLEQAVPLLNASGGAIWLFSTDGQWLELVSSLTTSSNHLLSRRAKGQGLVGWVADHGQPLRIDKNPAGDPRFDPRLDKIEGVATYSLLAVPLRHRGAIIGVLAIHNKHGIHFANPDMVLLEGVASLTASAIANARLMQELRDYAGQQRALYEMSQQIAAGLDLQATLNRVLQWIGRLSEVEIGLLWLLERSQDQDNGAVDMLNLVAALGINLPRQQQISITVEQDLVGWVARTGQAVMVNNPVNDPRFDPSISKLLNMAPRNIISVPMIYHDQIIGAISMFNKIEGDFDEVDLTLLSTAIEMVAVAVGNARLHTQTVALMEESKRLQEHVLQAERLATVGRLTASLSHEINNPMQTIRTALTLAKEELDTPKELGAYIDMSLTESERVVQLVNRMRQIYRPQSDKLEILDVNHLLQEAIAIARKELRRKRVTLETNLTPELPSLTAISNQLQLVFLNLILNLSDAIGAAGGGVLRLRSCALPQAIQVEFATNVFIASVTNWVHIFEMDSSQTRGAVRPGEVDISFGLSLSHDIVVAHGGAIDLSQQNGQTICRVELPLSQAGLSI